MSAHNPDNVSRHQGVYTPKEPEQAQAIERARMVLTHILNPSPIIFAANELLDIVQLQAKEIENLKQRIGVQNGG